MIRISPIFFMLLVVILSACGNLEWPPKSTGIGYSGNEIGLVNFARNTHKSPLTLSPQKKAKNFLESRIGENSREHIVANGETLWRIAQAHNTDIYELAILNQIEPPFRIYVGQSLILSNSPGKPLKLAAFKRTQGISREEFPLPTNSEKKLLAKGAPKIKTANDNLAFLAINPGTKPQTKRGTISSTHPPKISKRKLEKLYGTMLPPVRKGSLFIWPVKGTLISRFGAKGRELHNDGVNIMAPKGTVVRSAGSGIVAYAGNELRGFGNLLLVKHGNGWVTAYAHNEILTVRRGDKVKKGQAIARVGSSGNVFRPQLHFEIRKGNKAVDPILKISNINGRRATVHKRISKS